MKSFAFCLQSKKVLMATCMQNLLLWGCVLIGGALFCKFGFVLIKWGQISQIGRDEGLI